MADTKPLKIKLKTLAEEARIIRKEEQKMRGYFWGPRADKYHQHRVERVRTEARATLIAYGYLRGRRYEQIEGTKVTKHIPYERVQRMIVKYGGTAYEDITVDELKGWVRGGAPKAKAA